MEKSRAIPEGYMTVGEIAKRVGLTVRTLQYYDKEGVLSPSAQSEGGRRLYTSKDIVKLYQILTMKYLGFSLEDIKNRLPSLNTPQEVSELLRAKAQKVREKMNELKDVLTAIEKLETEVVEIKTVNWRKYADIVLMLMHKSDGYWVMKHYDGFNIEKTTSRMDNESGQKMLTRYNEMIKHAAKIQKKGCTPDSAQGQALAKEWWDFVMEYTGGDMNMLSELFEMGDGIKNDEWKNRFDFDKNFIGEALGIYFQSIGYNPYEGGAST